ncbi:MAG: hypothetical protein ACKKMW_02445 [Candidatus Nealsonbacteria bacterium]
MSEQDQNNIEKIDKNLEETIYKVRLAEDFIDFLKNHPRAPQDTIDNVEQVKKIWEEDLKKLVSFTKLSKQVSG